MPGPLLPSGRRPFTPAGVYYDGETQDLLLDTSTKQIKGVHPADEGMAMSALQRGSMKASPTTGNTLHEIKYLGGPNMQAQVEAAWRDANPLKRLAAAGDVTIAKISYELKNDRLWSACYYRNNRTGESREVKLHNQRLENYDG